VRYDENDVTMSVYVGIDAGGSSTRARAVRGHEVIHEARGGPGNPRTTAPTALRQSFSDALAGCPQAERVVACVAGAGSLAAREAVEQLLGDLMPRTTVTVVPDYQGAFHSLPPQADLCVIAGTGSVVCSPTADGWAVNGGRGWILGDHGGASRLGQIALSWFANAPEDAPPELCLAIEASFGDSDWRHLLARVYEAPAPNVVLATAAPILTRLATAGSNEAAALLRGEMALLADTVARHARRNLSGVRDVSVGLVGGVWSSAAAVDAFASQLNAREPEFGLANRTPTDPLNGALMIAGAFE
jgi:glucosamine kinase